MKASLFIVLQVQVYRFDFLWKRSITEFMKILESQAVNCENFFPEGKGGNTKSEIPIKLLILLRAFPSFYEWTSLKAWSSPLRLSGQVPVFSSQVSHVPWPRFTAVEAGVEVSHPDIEEGEEEDDHQNADDSAVHFSELPSRSKVLIRLLLDLKLLQPGACSGACEDILEPIWTSLRLEAGAGRLNIELVWSWPWPHACLFWAGPSPPSHQLAPAFFPREQSWTEAVLLHLTLLSRLFN